MKFIACFVLLSFLVACQQRPEEQRAEPPKRQVVTRIPPISVGCKAERSQGGVTVAVKIAIANANGNRLYRVSEVKTVLGEPRQYHVVGRNGSALQVSSRLYSVPDNIDFEMNYSGGRLEELREPTALQVWTIPLPIHKTVPPYTNVGPPKAQIRDREVESIEVEVGFFSTNGVVAEQPLWKNGFEPLTDSDGTGMLVDRQVVKTAACAIKPSAR